MNPRLIMLGLGIAVGYVLGTRDGRERYDAMEEVLDSNAGAITPDIAWQALQAASQEPNPKDVTSNTQWSILYDNTNCTATIALRRDWGNKTEIDLRDMTGF